jgi:hypothetical protein
LEQQRFSAKSGAEQQLSQQEQAIKDYEQQFQEYLKSPSGIIQSAKEGLGNVSVRYEKVAFGTGSKAAGTYGYSEQEVPVYTYTTPYGTFEDKSALQSAQGKVSYEAQKQTYDVSKAQYEQQLADLLKQGLTPVYSGATLTGFKDTLASNQFVPISTLETGYTRTQPTIEQPKTYTLPAQQTTPKGLFETIGGTLFKEPTQVQTTGYVLPSITPLPSAPRMETYFGQSTISPKNIGTFKDVLWAPFGIAGIGAKGIGGFVSWELGGLRRLAYGEPKGKVGELIRNVIPKQEQFKEVTIPAQTFAYPTKSTMAKGYDPFQIVIPESKVMKPSFTETLIGGAGLASTIGIYSLIPMAIASPMLIGEGVATAKDITKTPAERFLGIAEAGLGAYYGGKVLYKYARTPTIKYREMFPQERLQQREVVGRPQERITHIDPFGNVITQENFPVAGRQEIISAGRRTIVSETWRDILGLKPVYEGVPWAQPGAKQYLFKSKFLNIYEKKGYQAAQELLTTRTKLTPSEVSSILQLRKPTVAMQVYKGMGILTTTPKITTVDYSIKSDFLNYPRTADVVKIQNKFFPIRTRYAPTEELLINIRKIPLEELPGGKLLTKSIVTTTKLADISKTGSLSLGIGEQGKLTKTYDVFGITEPIKKVQIGEVFKTGGVSKQIIPLERYWKPVPYTKSLVVTGEPSLLITTESPISVRDIITPTKPTFGKVTFTTEQAKEIVKTLNSIYGKPTLAEMQAAKLSFVAKNVKELLPTGLIPPSKTVAFAKTILVSKALTTSGTFAGMTQAVKSAMSLKPSQALKTNEVLKTTEISKPMVITIPKIKTAVIPTEILATTLAVLPATKPITIPIVEPIVLPKIIPITIPKATTYPPYIPPPVITFKLPPVRRPGMGTGFKVKRRTKPSGRFTTFLRRRGKFVPIASVPTIQQAVEIGKRAARQTLGASIRVKGPRGFIPFAPQQEFRLGRMGKEPFTLVQRAPARLSSLGERREIKRTRTKKGGFPLW